LGKRKISTQKKPKSKKSAALIFILLICFSIFLCLFAHEFGTTGMGACLTKTTKEREKQKKKKKKRMETKDGLCEDEEDERGREKKIKE
jgi:predicted membrane protein